MVLRRKGGEVLSELPSGPWCQLCKDTCRIAYPFTDPDKIAASLVEDASFRQQFLKCHGVRVQGDLKDFVGQDVTSELIVGYRLEEEAQVLTCQQFRDNYHRDAEKIGIQTQEFEDEKGGTFRGIVIADPSRPRRLLRWVGRERRLSDHHLAESNHLRREQGQEVFNFLHEKLSWLSQGADLTDEEVRAAIQKADAAQGGTARVPASRVSPAEVGTRGALGDDDEEEEYEEMVELGVGRSAVLETDSVPQAGGGKGKGQGARKRGAGSKAQPSAAGKKRAGPTVLDTDSGASAGDPGTAAHWIKKLDLSALCNGLVAKAGTVLQAARSRVERFQATGDHAEAAALREHLVLAAAANELSRYRQLSFQELYGTVAILCDNGVSELVPGRVLAECVRAKGKALMEAAPKADPGKEMAEMFWPGPGGDPFNIETPRLRSMDLGAEVTLDIFRGLWDYILFLMDLGEPGFDHLKTVGFNYQRLCDAHLDSLEPGSVRQAVHETGPPPQIICRQPPLAGSCRCR
jgi:hypothetical protein